MDYEKAYKEALNRAKLLKDNPEKVVIENHKNIHASEYIFSELRESEDVKVKKSLKILLQHFCNGYRVPGLDFPVSYKDMLAWLEKQGEQNPVVWSEEDEKMFRGIIAICDIQSTKTSFYSKENDDIEKLKNWLKSLKCRVQPQSKQEWGEEDDNGLEDALWAIKQARTIAKDENDMGTLWYAERWLKTIKEKYQQG